MKRTIFDLAGIAFAFALLPCRALAFDSGSTGVDGDFNPTVSTQVALPPSGVLNYRSVNIPAGVTVSFKRNAANTPVVMLVQGTATIAGRIDVSGSDGAPTGSAAGGSVKAEGIPGRGGPGGFDGGRGAPPGSAVAGPLGSTLGPTGGTGLGPGGGGGGVTVYWGDIDGAPSVVGGGGFYSTGVSGQCRIKTYDSINGPRAEIIVAKGGSAYGSDALVPLIGGSGGGGGGAGVMFHGAGGGGGGGAILVAVSGRLDFTGSIIANGAFGGKVNEIPWSAKLDGNVCGGGGSGGAIRLMATTLAGNGVVSVEGGTPPFEYCGPIGGGSASTGRVRTEAEYTSRLVDGLPGPVFVTGDRSLRFTSVADIPVPASPTGSNDVTVPTATPNPVTITLTTSGVPVGSTVKVSVIPQYGQSILVDSPPTTGSLDNATTSVSLDIPPGHSVLSAQISFTVVAAVGDALSRFAQGERVEKVTLTSTLGHGGKATLHTVAGRQFDVDPALLALAAISQ